MKKVILMLVMFAVIVSARTGFGNTQVAHIQMYNNGNIDVITTTRPADATAFRFHKDHIMGKIWLAALMNAYNNKTPIFVYYNEGSASSPAVRTLDKVELK